LGIEYLKALKALNSNITPVTIKREGSQYHDAGLRHKFASATAIRKKIYSGRVEETKDHLPDLAYDIIMDEFKKGKYPINLDLLGKMIISSIRRHNRNTLKKFAEISNGLENRIYNEAHQTADLNELISNIKTKAFTWTRIQRNLLHILFDIKENDFIFLDQHGVQYIRILGIRKERTDLLAELKEKAELEIILNPSEILKEIDIDSNDPLIKSLSYDILAGDIYSLLYRSPKYQKGHLDFTTPLIKY
ncbi:MAG: nucleotidyltransferase family protein, partial [Halanaerobiaceae bacterium]|nr:nucleotidyltransferase family protein [Halanaerobiaceae bacterium]